MPPSSSHDLLAETTGLGRPGKSLVAKVRDIQAKVASGKKRAACKPLDAFAKEVRAQARKSLTQPQADALLAEAARISAVLGC